jgi:hypothetical protein
MNLLDGNFRPEAIDITNAAASRDQAVTCDRSFTGFLKTRCSAAWSPRRQRRNRGCSPPVWITSWDSELFNQARAAFRALAQAVDRLILIVGNHDQSPTNDREHALEAFKDFAMVVDTPQEIALGRATLVAFPFLRDAQEHRRLFKAYNRPSVNVVSTHVGVAWVPGRTFLIAEPVQRRHLATRAGGAGGYEAQGRRAPPDQRGEGRPRRGVPGRAAADAVGGHGPLAHRLPGGAREAGPAQAVHGQELPLHGGDPPAPGVRGLPLRPPEPRRRRRLGRAEGRRHRRGEHGAEVLQ